MEFRIVDDTKRPRYVSETNGKSEIVFSNGNWIILEENRLTQRLDSQVLIQLNLKQICLIAIELELSKGIYWLPQPLHKERS